MSDWKLKMSDFFDLEIKGTEKEKIFNFLNDHFSVMGGPMDMICGVFWKTTIRLLKSIISWFFSKYSKSYNILSAKSCFTFNAF